MGVPPILAALALVLLALPAAAQSLVSPYHADGRSEVRGLSPRKIDERQIARYQELRGYAARPDAAAPSTGHRHGH